MRDDETNLRGHRPAAARLGRRLHVLREEHAAAFPVELQFLDAVGERTEAAEQPVLFVTGRDEVVESAANQQLIDDRAEQGEDAHGDEHHRRQPAQIDCAGGEDGKVHRRGRHREERIGDAGDVLGERGHHARRADFLKLAQGHAEHVADEVATQVGRGRLREVRQRILRHEVAGKAPDAERDERPDQGRSRRAGAVEHTVHHGDQPGITNAARDCGDRCPDHHPSRTAEKKT